MFFSSPKKSRNRKSGQRRSGGLAARRLRHEPLEQRQLLSVSPTISIDDVTVDVQVGSMELIDAFVTNGIHLDSPRDIVQGPGGNLFVSSAITDSVLRYDADTGELLEEFVKAGSGGLDGPSGLAFGPDGNGDGQRDLYVGSYYNDAVLRYDGMTGDFIGEFIVSGLGGLDGPYNLLFDSSDTSDNLYVASLIGDSVLRYNSAGTYSGEFVKTGDGGFDGPSDLKFGSDGNLYVSSYYTDSVLRYDSAGTCLGEFVTTDSSGGLDGPRDMTFDSDGNLYVSSGNTDSVLRYNSAGTYLEAFVKTGDGGLDNPHGLFFDSSGDFYVASTYSDSVLRYDGDGNFIDSFITDEPGHMQLPVTAAFGPDGNLYVGDAGGNSVMRYDGVTGSFIDTFVPAGSGGLRELDYLAFDSSGNLYVSSWLLQSVLRYNPDGSFKDEFLAHGYGGLEDPRGLLFHTDGYLYVANGEGDSVLRYDSAGKFVDEFIPAGTGGLDTARDLTFDSSGNLYVSSYSTDSVLRYGPDGSFRGEFISTGSGGLDNSSGLAFGSDGNLYVGSHATDSVLRYDGTTGAFMDVVASADTDGLDAPRDLTFDDNGNLYVVSSYTDEVLRFGPAGQATLTVSLSEPSNTPVTVDYTTGNGTAKAGEDYSARSGTLYFAPGMTSRTILIPTSQTHITAPSESFFVALSEPSTNATIADDQGVATILWRFQPTELFADSFENGQWGGKWVEDSQNDWFTSTQRKTDGSYAAEVDGRATDATLTMSNHVNLTPYGSAELSFDWLIESGLDKGEYLALDLFNGASWQEVAKLSGNVDAENVWHHPVLTIDGDYLVNNFQLRFRAKMSGSDEDANVDNVRLIATSLAAPPNYAPVATADQYTVLEDNTLSVTALGMLGNDTDADGDLLTAQLVDHVSSGTLELHSNGAFTYTPVADFNGTDSFTYQAFDGTDYSNTATVTITVNPVNDAPVADDRSPATDEDTLLPITLTGSDVDGDSLTFTVESGPSNGVLSGTAPELTYMPGADFNGADSFTFKVYDGTVNSDPATVTITVNPINDAPIISDIANQTIDEDTETGALAFTIGDVDTLLDSLTVSGESSNTTLVSTSNIVFAGSGANRTVTVTPAPDQYGTATISVTVDDGSETATDIFVVTVTAVNDAPVADDQNVAAKENTGKAITLTASDVEGDVLTYTVLNGPANGSLTGSGATRTYIPNGNFNGSDSFTFKAYDGSADSNEATVSITVADNNAPMADSQSVSVDEDGSTAITLTGLDPDGDPITYIVIDSPSRGVLTGTVPNLTYKPYADLNGPDSFTFKVNDGTDDSAAATVSITVNPVNDIPTANDQSQSTDEDTALALMLTGKDIDGDALTFQVVSGPGNGTLTGTAPNLTYTPGGDFNGTDSFTFKVNDGTVDSAEATFSITIDPINDAPVAVNDLANTDQDTAVTVNVLANDTDVDNDPLTITITGNTNGTAVINNQGTSENPTDDVVDFMPTDGFSGQASFTYTVNDGALTSNEATVTIDVTPVSPGPILDKGQVVARSDQWTTVTLDNSYTSMVVVLTPNYDRTQVPMVARMQEVSKDEIKVRLDRTDGKTGIITDVPVHYMVVEAGVYTLNDDGVKMEAFKFNSTRTDEDNSWVGEARSYQQPYTQPIVVGQVMSYNDPDWSVFWARGSSRTAAPNGSLYVGKHVGEDPDNTRVNETVGYIVIEGGAGSIGGIGYVAGLGTDTIRGVTDGNGFTYNIEHLDNAKFAVASAAGMDGGNGGWPVLYGSDPVTENTLVFGFDEDQMKDSERAHTTEQVAYIVLDPPAESFAAADTNQDGHVTPLDALLVINWLNASGSSHTNADNQPLDVNHDGTLTPADALWVINDLNRGASGEGEAVLRDTHAAERQMATARALDRIFNDLGDEADAWSLSDDLLDDIA